MLARDSAIYLLARVFPAIFSFASIALLTRWLPPEEYGVYALIMSAAILLSTIVFTWNSHAVFRYYAEMRDLRGGLLRTGFIGYILSWGFAAILIFTISGTEALSFGILEFSVVLLSAGAVAWLDLCGIMLNLECRSISFAALQFLRKGVALVAAFFAAWVWQSAVAVAAALAAGNFAVGMLPPFLSWLKEAMHGEVRLDLVKRLFRYGLPLSLALALMQIVGGIDRWMLALMKNKAAVAEYAVGYDLIQFTIIAIGSALNMAFYSRLLHIQASEGDVAAREHLGRYLLFLLAALLPASAGLAMVAPGLAGILVGAELRPGAIAIMPWISAAMFLAALKSYYADYAFQIGRWTIGGTITAFATLALNVGLNFLFIPHWGATGAAITSTVSFAFALGLSVALGRLKGFRLPLPSREHLKPMLAVAAMTALLWPLYGRVGIFWLLAQVAAGIVVYGVTIYISNPFRLFRNGRIFERGGVGFE